MIEDVENCTYCASGMGCYHHSSKWMSEKIKDLQSRLDMAVECLKFYAAEENWEFTSDFHGHESYEEIKDDEECTAPCMSYGGKRAREVLKQIQGEENERK